MAKKIYHPRLNIKIGPPVIAQSEAASDFLAQLKLNTQKEEITRVCNKLEILTGRLWNHIDIPEKAQDGQSMADVGNEVEKQLDLISIQLSKLNRPVDIDKSMAEINQSLTTIKDNLITLKDTETLAIEKEAYHLFKKQIGEMIGSIENLLTAGKETAPTDGATTPSVGYFTR